MMKVCWKETAGNKIVREKVDRQCTIGDPIKQTKLKLFKRICRIKYE